MRGENNEADAFFQRDKNSIIIGHRSFFWSIDELAPFYDNNNVSVQWRTIGENLQNAEYHKRVYG